LSGWEHYSLPALDDTISLHEQLARRTNPDARCIGLCVNTSTLSPEKRKSLLQDLRDRHGLPAVDPLIDGCGEIVDFVRSSRTRGTSAQVLL